MAWRAIPACDSNSPSIRKPLMTACSGFSWWAIPHPTIFPDWPNSSRKHNSRRPESLRRIFTTSCRERERQSLMNKASNSPRESLHASFVPTSARDWGNVLRTRASTHRDRVHLKSTCPPQAGRVESKPGRHFREYLSVPRNRECHTLPLALALSRFHAVRCRNPPDFESRRRKSEDRIFRSRRAETKHPPRSSKEMFPAPFPLPAATWHAKNLR